MDQGADRGRPFHGIGQPDVERNLGRLADGPAEQKQGNDRGQGHVVAEEQQAFAGQSIHPAEDLMILEAAQLGKNQKKTEDEAEIAEAVDNKGLLAGIGSGRFLVIKSDQQIGGKADRLPAEKKLEKVVAQDQHEHGKGEKAQVSEKSVIPVFPLHVAHRIDMHQRADTGDHQQHHRG